MLLLKNPFTLTIFLANNIDDAIDQLGNKRLTKHPEKKVRAVGLIIIILFY